MFLDIWFSYRFNIQCPSLTIPHPNPLIGIFFVMLVCHIEHGKSSVAKGMSRTDYCSKADGEKVNRLLGQM